MAILTWCCCCRSLRKGSYACAVYSLVYYLILAVSLRQFIQGSGKGEEEGHHQSVLMNQQQYHEHFSVVGMVMLTLSLAGPFTCVLLVIGLFRDIKYLLIPWIVDAILIIILDIVFVAYIVYTQRTNLNPVIAITFTFDFFSLVLNVYTVLCVISQYQEYLAGRGRASDDGSRSPPTIRYCRQSTMNSGMDSTRRTVTFLEHGVLTNGLSPNSHVKRTPSIIHKDEFSSIDINTTHNGNGALVTGQDGSRMTKSHKKHVQFPADTIEESECSDGEMCAIIPAKDIKDLVSETPRHSQSSPKMSPEPKEKQPSASCVGKDSAKDRQISCLTSPKGPEATPLIKLESPEEGSKRF